MSKQFELGRFVATPGVLREVPFTCLIEGLLRHAQCDWGEADAYDKEVNNHALKDGSRLFSVYKYADDRVFWVITEADRSTTTALLPDEY